MRDPAMVMGVLAIACMLLAAATTLFGFTYIRLERRHRSLRHDFCAEKARSRYPLYAIEMGEGDGRRRIEYGGTKQELALRELQRLAADGIEQFGEDTAAGAAFVHMHRVAAAAQLAGHEVVNEADG